MSNINKEKILETFLDTPMFLYFTQKIPHKDETELRTKITELLKFLMLCCHDDLKGEVLFSEEIDNVWHYWILQTQQYQDLCKKLPTGKFVHHSSNDYRENEMSVEPGKIAERNLDFFSSYIENFGEISDETLTYWPGALEIMSLYSWDLKTFNNELTQISA